MKCSEQCLAELTLCVSYYYYYHHHHYYYLQVAYHPPWGVGGIGISILLLRDVETEVWEVARPSLGHTAGPGLKSLEPKGTHFVRMEEGNGQQSSKEVLPVSELSEGLASLEGTPGSHTAGWEQS